MNPLQHLYDACNTGDGLGKYSRLPDFPKIIDIELTSACNFGCLMCPTGNLSLKRPAEFMKSGTFIRIVDQCEDTALRFIGWGEPMLHPMLDQFVAYAHGKGLLTHLNTNGSKMTKKTASSLAAAGLSSLKFSFQGVDRQSYQEMRATDWFRELVKVIRMVSKMESRPWLQVSTSTTYETQQQIDAFVKLMRPLVDQLSIGKTIFDFMDMAAVRSKDRELLERLRDLESVEKVHPDPCPEVFDKLSIHADGSVRVCCNDFDGITNLGNVNNTPLSEIWMHSEIEAYRKRLAVKDYDAPLCRDCYDYMGLQS